MQTLYNLPLCEWTKIYQTYHEKAQQALKASGRPHLVFGYRKGLEEFNFFLKPMKEKAFKRFYKSFYRDPKVFIFAVHNAEKYHRHLEKCKLDGQKKTVPFGT